MSYKTAEKISRETGRFVEWNPANRKYVIWPTGEPIKYARDVRKRISVLERIERNSYW